MFKKIFKILKLLIKPKFLIITLHYNLKRLFFDFYFIFKKPYKYNFIFIAGLPMSASTWIKNMCGLIPGYFTRYTPMNFETSINHNINESAFRFSPRWSYSLFKTHLNPYPENLSILKKNNVKKIIVSYRDLRDVAVARYNRLLKFPKKKNEPHYLPLEKQYRNISKEEGINDSIRIVAEHYPKWIYGWKKIDKEFKDFILFCKFEDLVQKPENTFREILNFYEIKLEPPLIREIIEKTRGKKNMIINFNEHQLLPFAYGTNFRSGKIGGWKDEFSKKNKEYFKTLAGEHLIKLNYESDNNW